MGFSVNDVVPFTLARANLSELADQAKAGAEKIITKNGESYVALIDADRLDYYHRLERERTHLLLLDDAKRGLADIAAGRTVEADAAIGQLQQRRAAAKAPSRRPRQAGDQEAGLTVASRRTDGELPRMPRRDRNLPAGR
ncbi:type II toxin-antitoxin system Phd/YefM family antitoxin [Xanthomonas indica]|uniref:Antitoxin n=1 Tax=Xanthomonas indica TaxID=2912242 RepID=A0AAU8I740_9XANT|nr:type II toxin-antitoxin system Phd/YefM family antitoxin [Xanthomonas indica]MCI2263816.1 type II toxin-antitoxin system Phd/YefM family antitoxin [Xanthomonas indica]